MSQPHDSIFKAVFGQTENAAGLLRAILSTESAELAELANAIDWSTLSLQPGSFIDERLKPSHTDLLFSALLAAGGDPLLIYVLTEHQSDNERRMPLRLYRYMDRIWASLDEGQNGVLPPILCIVLSHARPRWTGKLTFGALFDPRVIRHPVISQFVPNFSIVVEDLAHRSDAELAALRLASLPTLTLWMLRDGHTEELLWAGLDFWGRRMVEVLLSPDGALFLSYFRTRIEGFSWPEVRAKLARVAPEAKDMLNELYEDLRAEGREQGLQQGLERGLERGRIAMLTRLLSLKFGELSAQVQARLESAGIAELDEWAERVLRASTLDEVFAD